MTEYEVRRIIQKVREEDSPGPIGCILMLASLGLLCWGLFRAGAHHRAELDEIKARIERVEKLLGKEGD